jgi:acyl transferase domain-containing protein/acyl carrier protein
MDDHSLSTVTSDLDIAIVGMAGHFPGARHLDDFWKNLRDGVETISSFTDQDLEQLGVDPIAIKAPNYVKSAPILENIDCFDASFFGFTPREAEIMDPQHRVFLECAWEALEHAGYDSAIYPGLIGVYASASLSTYLLFNLLNSPRFKEAEDEFELMIGNDKDFLSTLISYKLNLKGPSITIQTGCSSSFVAVHLACQSLLTYQCDVALAGGVSINIPQRTGYYYREGGIASPDGHCRAFDAKAQGSVFGSGVGIVVLKRLEDARADKDYIHAVIKSSAINNDGALKVGYTAPSVDGQADVIVRAQAIAGINADTISYVETHGTGTDLGDTAELAALTRAFRLSTEKQGFCAIGSVKTNIGHLDTAAGVAGLLKTVLALEHKSIPASLHFEQPNPKTEFQHSPFYVNTALSEWKVEATPRRAGVSSFGIGGTNVHIIVEEAPSIPPSDESRPWQALLLSAKTNTALESATAHLAEHLRQQHTLKLADVAFTLQCGRRLFLHRRLLVCRDLNDAITALEANDPQRILSGVASEGRSSIVFMFAGLGDQYLNMALDIYQSEAVFREQVNRGAELIKRHLGFDLRDVLYPDRSRINMSRQHTAALSAQIQPRIDLRSMLFPQGISTNGTPPPLNQTVLLQPILFVIEYALAQLWMAWGIQPTAMIGYSIGEYVAACLAGVLSFEDALFLVARRAQLIDALPPGAMLAVPMSEQEIQPLLTDSVSLAAVNGRSLCVLGGPLEAIAHLEQQLKSAGVVSRRLQTSHAFHSSMMTQIAQRFFDEMKHIPLKSPQIPYVSTVTGRWIKPDEATDRSYWVKHLCQTIRFSDGLEEILRQTDSILLEIGPGQTLSGFAIQHPAYTADRVVLPSMRQSFMQQPDLALLLTTLGRLWLAGYPVDWSKLYVQERRQRVPLPTYPFERKRYWIAPGPREIAPRCTTNHTKKPDMADWFYLPSWKRSHRPMPQQTEERLAQRHRWLIFADRCDLGSHIAEQLQQLGQDVTCVQIGQQFERIRQDYYTINPRQSADYAALIERLRHGDQVPERIVHCWSVTSGDTSSSQSFQQTQDIGFYSLLFLTQALVQYKITTPITIWSIGNGMHEVESGDQMTPEKTTIFGPCKVIPQEYDFLTCRCVDVVVPPRGSPQVQALAHQLVAELSTTSPDAVIAYRGKQRWAQAFEPVRLEEAQIPIRSFRNAGVYLITGGLGGIGLTLADYLARTFQAKLILIGRSAFPEPQLWQAWLAGHDPQDDTSRKIRAVQALEAAGAEVLVQSADMAIPQQLRAVFQQTQERFGRIDGVIHTAGISGRQAIKLIPDIDVHQANVHFQAKIQGVYTLETILKDMPVDFCLLFSSNASILGGIGCAAYAAANIFMDNFANDRNQQTGSQWISANWDVWASGEELSTGKGYQTSIDQYAMLPAEGVEAFRRVVCLAASSQIVIATGDLSRRLDIWISQAGLHKAATTDTDGALPLRHTRPQLGTVYVPPSSELEQRIAEVWQELIGIDQVGIHDSFFDLGGNSLIALKLIAHLNQELHIDLPVTRIFEGPTVHALASIINQEAHQPTYEQSRNRGELRRQKRLHLQQDLKEG